MYQFESVNFTQMHSKFTSIFIINFIVKQTSTTKQINKALKYLNYVSLIEVIKL